MARNDMDKLILFATSGMVEKFHKVATVSGICARCEDREKCAMYVKTMQGAFDKWLAEKAKAN